MAPPDPLLATDKQLSLTRRAAVLESALVTFTRYGYRKSSMADVAVAAHISRPGLYFLFESKEHLFRSAITHALETDLMNVERILELDDDPLRARLLKAFDQWAGRYLGPASVDLAGVIREDPQLIGDVVHSAPQRFEELITLAIMQARSPADRGAAAALAQTAISLSVGIKYQVVDRSEFLERLSRGLELLIR